MKIGIDASRANLDKKTGVEWYSYNLIQNLKDLDKENQYFLYSQDKLKGELSVLPDNFSSKILKWNLKKGWTQLKLWFNSLRNKDDILFIPAGMIPIIPFRLSRLITTIHDVCFLDYPEYYSKKELFIQKLAFKLGMLFSNKIITVSEFTKQKILENFNCKESKIIVTHLGYNDLVYKKINNDIVFERLRKKYNLPENFVLYIGRIEEKKNILNQIKAFNNFSKKYPDYKFVLIGKQGFGYNKIKTEIFKNNLEDDIIELGYIETDEVVAIINMAKVFMFVSNYEGFGLPILEAMACGVPVITSNTTSLPEIAGNAALYAEPNNTIKITENLFNIIENKDGIRYELIENGYKNIKKFTWNECANKTLLAFKNK